MADHAEVIRQQMADTRASMTDKIEALEKQVSETVKETTDTVSETVDTASNTVQKTVEAISSTVETVKETFDIPAHIQNHPWMAMGGAVAVGYVLGSLFPGHQQTVATPATPTPTPVPVPMPTYTPPAHTEHRSEAQPAQSQSASSGLGEVLTSLRGMAVGTTIGLLGEVILKAVPGDLRGRLSGWIQRLTEALGGQPPGHS